jgi:uncharacterized protein
VELVHDFTVPARPQQTWAAFSDIESVAGCFPGATVSGVEGDAFQGSVKVKLGPIALVYNGSGTITGKDEAAGRLLLSAKGKDKRGNGTASAEVTVTMTGSGPDETSVHVETVLQITGKPAQFGRSVMQDVSDKLLDQFTACLAKKLGESGPVADQASVAEAAEPSPAPTLDPPRATSAPPAPAGRSDEAIDLGTTVLPVLVRTYWRQLVAGLAAVLLLRRVVKRRR